MMTSNNDLLDIGKSLEKLTGTEKAFYDDQKTTRIARLSEQVDEEYETERENARKQIEEEVISQNNLENFINPVEFKEVVTPTPTERSLSRRLKYSNSPKPGATTSPLSIPSQGISPLPSPQPSVRKNIKNANERFKDAIATVSYRTALSVPKSRVAVQAVCEKLYSHRYYLSLEEKRKFAPLETIQEQNEEPINKKPRTSKDYEQYSDVLPSAKVVTTYKHEKAVQQEIDAAEALSSIEQGTKCTLHFDTTGRSRVEGEWPALIFNFLSDDEEKC